MERRLGFSLLELMMVIAGIATLSALALPLSTMAVRAADERNAATSLKSLVGAEADFAGNDRDGNRVRDFWTGDLAGLHGMTSAAVSGNEDPMLRLIDAALAGADAAPLADGAAGGHYRENSAYGPRAPKCGYWYYALRHDPDREAPSAYRTDTGGAVPMGAVHHPGAYAFLAFPDRYAVSGRRVFVVNENGAVYGRDPGGSIRNGESIPAGAPRGAFADWPPLSELRARWTTD